MYKAKYQRDAERKAFSANYCGDDLCIQYKGERDRPATVMPPLRVPDSNIGELQHRRHTSKHQCRL